jgi:hypothetical protein
MTAQETELRKRISQATQLLPSDCDRAAVKDAVETVYYRQTRKRIWSSVYQRPTTKAEKANIRASAKALRRFLASLRAAPELVWEKFDVAALQARLSELEALSQTKLDRAKGRRDDVRQLAADQAALLLTRHNLRLAKSRNGKLAKLAAILLGDPQAKLIHYLARAVLDHQS